MGSGNSKIKSGAKRKSIASFVDKDLAELATSSSASNISNKNGASNGAKGDAEKGSATSPRRSSAPAVIAANGRSNPSITTSPPTTNTASAAAVSSAAKPSAASVTTNGGAPTTTPATPMMTVTVGVAGKPISVPASIGSPPHKHLGSPPPNAGIDTDADADADASSDADADADADAGEESDPTAVDKSDDNGGDTVDDLAASQDSMPMVSSIGGSLSELSATPRSALAASFGGRLVRKEKYDLDDIISRLLDARNSKVSKNLCLKNSEVVSICHKAREVFLSQPVLLELLPPVNIVGDIHGQFHDLLRIFDLCGYPPNTNYLFLGDYVDRGKQSLETILLLLCYKIKYPENFFILRGNHECASVNRVYGFYDECKRRCSLKIWRLFTDVFNCLPIAALVAGKIFCVHGGLSPSLHSMDDIRAVTRPSDVPDFGLLNDLLWSDPSDLANDWEDNERGVSYCFSKSIVSEFLARHDLDLVCRAHMVVEEGYEFFNNRTLVTVFSAPNYCGEFDNKGAIMCVNEDLLCSFEILQPQSHPLYKKGRRLSPPLGK